MKKEKASKKIKLPSEVTVRQIHSQAGRTQDIYDGLASLGLGRIGKQRTFKNPQAPLMGVIRKLGYLLEVKEV